MKYYGKKSLSQALKIILDVLLVVGALYFFQALKQSFKLKGEITSSERF